MDEGWLKVTLMYFGMILISLNYLKELSFKLKVTSKKLTIFKFEQISFFNLIYSKALITFFRILDMKIPALFGKEIKPLCLYIPLQLPKFMNLTNIYI